MMRRTRQVACARRPRGRLRRPRRGTILVVTIWIMVVLVGMVLVLARAMSVEAVASANDAAELQADAIEQGAVQYVIAHVDSLGGAIPSDTDMPCEGVKIGPGAFWILRPNFDDPHAPAYGLVDEAGKLNLNTASEPMLAALPGMTPDIAASIVDWRDTDDNVTQSMIDGGIGAESQYYLLSDSPYECKSAPFETVEEALLVKDVTTDLLHGTDRNRNGVLDAGEDAAGTGVLDRGVAPFLTVYSADANSDPAAAVAGTTLVSVNTLSAISDLLNTQLGGGQVLQQVTAYLSPRGGGRGGPVIPGRTYTSLLDFYAQTPALTAQQFAQIAPLITVPRTGGAKGLINISTAPAEVIGTLTNLTGNFGGPLTEEDVQALVAYRAQGGIDGNNIAWVAQAITDRAKLSAIGRYLTTLSYQFSADIVSVTANGRAFRRCRVVLDASVTPPKVVYRRNLTPLGWPLPEDILSTLRAGKGLDEAVAAGRTQTLTLGQP